MEPEGIIGELFIAVVNSFCTVGLQCYICDSTSYVSYSDAETDCNAGNLGQCPDTKVRAFNF